MSDQELWAPWHPKHGFLDEFMPATWISPDLDEIVGRVKRLNQDDKTNNRNGWRAVKVTFARVEQLSDTQPEK